MNIGICAFPPFVFPKRQVRGRWAIEQARLVLGRDGCPPQPGLSPHPEEVRKAVATSPAPVVGRLLPFTGETCSGKSSTGCAIVQGRHMSHRRGNAPSWVLVELEDQVQGPYSLAVQRHDRRGPNDSLLPPSSRPTWNGCCGARSTTVPGETGTWGSFCKTQYANEFGLPNFLRAHMTVCAILEKAQDIGFKVTVNDEGGFLDKTRREGPGRRGRAVGPDDCGDVRGDEGCRPGRSSWNRPSRTVPISSIWK